MAQISSAVCARAMTMLLVLGTNTLPGDVFSFKSLFGEIDAGLMPRGKTDIPRA
jgi:hypothetical protein